MSTETVPAHGGPQSLFYSRASTKGMPRIVRGEGVHLWADDGRRFIDVASGVYLTSLGQGNERVLQAMVEQGRTLTFSFVRNTVHDANVRLADRIAALAGPGFERVHLSSGGSEANEIAIKFLRQYAYAAGEPQRHRVISCMPSYHGATLGVLALNGPAVLPSRTTITIGPSPRSISAALGTTNCLACSSVTID
ncbi:MAG TPA: aminotransferase class III-fold pyridoxal phosphate-dependent enzyme, partial [Conexibacter sp.]|nr:aminotransferase class III-fold pyridoxal phosphate-dependent enzyme [Conexibacter sp.]